MKSMTALLLHTHFVLGLIKITRYRHAELDMPKRFN